MEGCTSGLMNERKLEDCQNDLKDQQEYPKLLIEQIDLQSIKERDTCQS